MALAAPALALASLLAAQNPAWPARDPDLSAAELEKREHMPGDPAFAPSEGCAGQLELYAFTPACAAEVRAGERALGTGIHADRAWLLTTGRPEVTIAVLDTAFDLGERDLAGRWRLNAGELPVPLLPGGAAPRHDRNGDGAFTVLDYTSATGTSAPLLATVIDTRLRARADGGDANHNGLLDPADLIAIFSDGVDDDADGYADDIAGWDFVDGDNDPSGAGAESAHGTQIALAAAAEANNGWRGAGVCPRCTLLPGRVATPALAPAHALAEGISFAAFSDARVILSGVPPTDTSPLLIEAVQYAGVRDALIVAGAGNTSSGYRAAGWDPGRVLIAAGLGAAGADPAKAESFFTGDRCSGRGPHVGLALPGACDDAPAALLAGVAGLAISASLGLPAIQTAPLSPPLGARELHEMLLETADRPPGSRDRETTWTATLGYGRVNARAAVEAVARRAIPPVAVITSPAWSRRFDPTSGAGIPITGRVENPRYEAATWLLEYGPGPAPRAGEMSPVAAGKLGPGETADIAGLVPTAGLTRDPTAPPSSAGAFAVTVRLSVSAMSTGAVVRGEARRAVHVHRDLDLLPLPRRTGPLATPIADFTVALGAPASCAPRVLEDGSSRALVVATTDGRVHALDASGSPLPGWPVRAAPPRFLDGAHALAPPYADGAVGALAAQSIAACPSAARIYAGGPFVVAAATLEGDVLVYDLQGNLPPGFPAHVAGSVLAAPALADLDGDGRPEIVVTTVEGTVDVFGLDGARRKGFPLRIPEGVGAPAIGDLDRDGRPEIVAASHARVFALSALGEEDPAGPIRAGWPVELEAAPFSAAAARVAAGAFVDLPPGPILADVDGDGALEVVVVPVGRQAVVLTGDGGRGFASMATDRGRFGQRAGVGADGDPIVAFHGEASAADLDGDGVLDLVAAAGTVADLVAPAPKDAAVQSMIAAWSLGDGDFTDGFPQVAGDRARGGMLVADLDGDGRPEVIFGDGEGRLHAYSAAGGSPRGWPKLTAGAVGGTPGIGDLDADGFLEVYAATREGVLLGWRTEARADAKVPWRSHRHDLASTGNLETPAEGGTAPAEEEGCGCNAARGAKGGLGLSLLLAGLLVARRRRSAWALALLLSGCAMERGAAKVLLDAPYPAYAKERTVRSRRARAEVRVAEIGSSTAALPLVFLHPWATSMRIWSGIAPELAEGRRVLLVDFPGHGKSSKPPGRYPPRRLAGAVLDAMDEAGISRAVVIGNSLGGAVALELAVTAPERVAGLVLLAAPGGVAIPPALIAAVSRGVQPSALGTASSEAVWLAWFVLLQGDAPLGGLVRDEMLARRALPDWEPWAHATSSALLEVATAWRPAIESIGAPALVLQGDRDIVVWPAWGAALAKRIPGSRFEPIAGCGHFLEVECPDEVLARIRPFLATLR